jgi:Spy/CpxP family protein refolding chaperone
MNRRKPLIILFAGCLLLAGAMTAFASIPRRGQPAEGGPGLRYLLLKAFMQLNLSDSQEHEIALILKQNRDENREMMRKMMEARRRVGELTMADDLNEEAIRQAVREVASYGEKLAVKRAMVLHDIKKVLTPEQLTVVQQLREEMASKGKDRLRSGVSLLDAWIDAHSQ